MCIPVEQFLPMGDLHLHVKLEATKSISPRNNNGISLPFDSQPMGIHIGQYQIEKPKKVEKACAKAVYAYTQYLQRKKCINAEIANQFTDRLMQITCARIAKQSKIHVDVGENFNIPLIFKELRKMQQEYVITSADKAGNNMVFICKYWYFKVMCEELGVSLIQDRLGAVGNHTYTPVQDTVCTIIDRHVQLAKHYDLEVSNQDSKLPIMFANPKLHKSPYGWRFIAGAKFSSNKTISVRLHVILSSLKRHFKNYCGV
ncbi:MAG: hypothetical protein GY679_04295, partial [Mycoplasma sp.]|nr:hypothetical protein [Mycoplasma sp.]